MKRIQHSISDASSLEATLHRFIPATKALKLTVVTLASGRIRLEAPVGDTNVNIHGTAFAGSIYSVSALAAWGLAYQHLRKLNLPVDLVIAEGCIRYKQPLEGKIVASTGFTQTELDDFVSDIEVRGKAVLTAYVEISDESKSGVTNRVKLVATKHKKRS